VWLALTYVNRLGGLLSVTASSVMVADLSDMRAPVGSVMPNRGRRVSAYLCAGLHVANSSGTHQFIPEIQIACALNAENLLAEPLGLHISPNAYCPVLYFLGQGAHTALMIRRRPIQAEHYSDS
jgi:hypothetical protein